MNGYNIQEQVRAANGNAMAVARRFGDMMFYKPTGTGPDGQPTYEIGPEHFSLREAWEGFVGPVRETLGNGRGGFQMNRLIEANRSQAFIYATGITVIRKVLDAYNRRPSTLDKLIEPMSSSLRQELMVGFQAFSNIKIVPEGQEYPRTGFADRATLGPEPDKYGAAIEISDEAVRLDQTGDLLRRAGGMGDTLFQVREQVGMYSIQDQASVSGFTTYAFYPMVNGTGTQTALYRSTAAGAEWYNKTVNKTGSNTLVDWTNLNKAWQLTKSITDEAGIPILFEMQKMLVPMELYATAMQIVGAPQVRQYSPSYGAVAVGQNPLSWITPGLEVLTSPFMVDTSTWYMGDPQRQFVEQVIVPTEVTPLVPDPTRDIVAGFRVRRKSRVFATDDKFFLQSTT